MSITDIATKPVKLFFQDEARFGRISQPLRAWSPIGKRPVIPSQHIRQYTYAYGAVCPEDGAFVSLILPSMRTDCMAVFLEEISQRYPDNHVVVVLDGAACHRSQSLNVPQDMSLVALPPYSPELNPQENVWKAMRAEGFYNRVFESMDAVEDALVKVCRVFERSADRLRRLTCYPWIQNALN